MRTLGRGEAQLCRNAYPGRIVVDILGVLDGEVFMSDLQKYGVALTDSLSGSNTRYMEAVKRACTPEGFKTFRRDPAYQEVLEHVTPEMGLEYYKEVLPRYRGIEILVEAAKNDNIGLPSCQIAFPGKPKASEVSLPLLSPTTLRYLKVVSDLEKLFGSLDGFRITEIGVGYGGQCRLIEALFQLKSYTLIDLEEPLALTAMYLRNFAPRLRYYVEADDVHVFAGEDLAISNYAFSELKREAQEFYIQTVLSKSARGYITCNNITPERFNSIKAEELAERMNGRILPEVPLTHKGNSIVVWE